MAFKDIEKLKEKFEKDPNSKLFLPLAEEYRKEGMLDEAIEVLKGGIERHASYTSARVLLGKIYLEKGLMDEARNEFENVVKTVPDNLYAQKKLAEIYRDTGEAGLAVKTYTTILKLNPLDEESINALRDIEAVSSPEKVVEGQKKGPEPSAELRMSVDKEEEAVSGASVDLPVSEDVPGPAPAVREEHSEEELHAFKDSLFGGKSGLGDELESLSDVPDEAVGNVSIPEEDVASVEEDFSLKDVGELLRDAEGAELGEIDLPASDADDTLELIDETDEIFGEPADLSFQQPDAVPQGSAGIADADRFVAEGQYFEAMDVYRKFLSSDPNNRTVLQRVEELRSLLKLMGKDKEVLIARLDAFLAGIQKRRNEFFERP